MSCDKLNANYVTYSTNMSEHLTLGKQIMRRHQTLPVDLLRVTPLGPLPVY